VPLFVAAFFLARLPFLFAGYGADTDAYRVVLAGRYLWATGEYLPSRLPGYPLHELLTALLLGGGPLLTNLSTALAALLGVWVFDRLVVRLGVPGRPWLLLAMAFIPWLLVTSTATLDYHFALTAMLAAYLALTRHGGQRAAGSREGLRAAALAGLYLGVAVGFRITAAAFLLPLAVLLVLHNRRAGRPIADCLPAIAALVATTGAVALLAYAPVLWTYGPRFWNYADSRVSPDVVIQMVGQWALGAVGALVTLGVLAASWRELARFPRRLARDPHVLVWSLTVVLYALIYLRVPVDIGYLVPLYPFAFLLVARVLRPWALPVILAAALLSGLVDLTIQGVHNFSPRLAAQEIRPSWRVAGFFHDYRTRTRWLDYAERPGREPVPPHSVILTGGAFPNVAVLAWDRLRYQIIERDLNAVSMISDNGSLWDDERDLVYLAVSEPRIIERFRAAGYTIYRATPEGPGWDVKLTALP
jgi:hypothetical protein